MPYNPWTSLVRANTYVGIEKTNFIDNVHSIYLQNHISPRITQNDFDFTRIPGGYPAYGLYLDNSDGYHVESNNFHLDGTYAFNRGVFANNSGTRGNLIYNNTFQKVRQAIVSQQDNRGLRLICNTMGEYLNGVLVNYQNFPKSQSGIYRNQGYCNSVTSGVAGGSDAGNVLGNGVDLYSNIPGFSADYYHRNNTAYVPNIYSSHFTPLLCNYSIEEHPCNSDLPVTGGGISDTPELISMKTRINGIYTTISQSSDQDEIERLQLDYDVLYNEITLAYLNRVETIVEPGYTAMVYNTDLTDLISFYEGQRTLTGVANPNLVVAYIKDNDTYNAQDVLDQYKYDLGGTLNNYGDYLQVLIDLYDQSNDELSLTQQAEDKLREISEKDSEYGYVQALQILRMNFGEEFSIPIVYPPGSNPPKRRPEEIEDSIFVNKLQFRPNPVNDIVWFTIDVNSEAKSSILKITNEMGILVSEIVLKPGKSNFEYETKNIDVGLYLIQFLVDDEVVQTDKLIKY